MTKTTVKGERQNKYSIKTLSAGSTCVVLSFEVKVVQFVNVADVHFLLVQLRFVEVLIGKNG